MFSAGLEADGVDEIIGGLDDGRVAASATTARKASSVLTKDGIRKQGRNNLRQDGIAETIFRLGRPWSVR